MATIFKDYNFEIHWTSSKPFDVTNDSVEVRITTADGNRYMADFVTRKFLDTMFEKNKLTGECASGSYFAMPRMIVVDKLCVGVIKSTLDDLIANDEADFYFKKFH